MPPRPLPAPLPPPALPTPLCPLPPPSLPPPTSPSLAHCVSSACSEVRRTFCLGGRLRCQEANALRLEPHGVGDHYHVPIKVRTPVLRNGSDILGPALFRGQWRARVWPLCPPQGWLWAPGWGPPSAGGWGVTLSQGPAFPASAAVTFLGFLSGFRLSPIFPAGSWDGGPSTQTPRWWLRGKAGKVKLDPPSPGAGGTRWAPRSQMAGCQGPASTQMRGQSPARRGCHVRPSPVPTAAPSPGEGHGPS